MSTQYGLHKPQCRLCLDDWPCEYVRKEQEAELFAHKLSRTCHYCGQYIPAGVAMEQFGGEAIDGSGVVGPKFHISKKKYPQCAIAAKYYKAKWQARNEEKRAGRGDWGQSGE